MPIAMENSVEELKTVARYITKSNDDSGVAYAIKNFILHE
jgi:hydroxymethylpyrimidine pyrophosphatase-like HAD family hydrolase